MEGDEDSCTVVERSTSLQPMVDDDKKLLLNQVSFYTDASFGIVHSILHKLSSTSSGSINIKVNVNRDLEH